MLYFNLHSGVVQAWFLFMDEWMKAEMKLNAQLICLHSIDLLKKPVHDNTWEITNGLASYLDPIYDDE